MTLTELSYYSRKLLPFFILFFLIIMILFYLVRILLLYFQTIRPKAIYTNPVFGKIKRPVIEEATTSASHNFVLDTIEGKPTTATQAAQVYYLPPPVARFGYREKIYLMAKNLGFDTTQVKHKLINEKEAVFSDFRQKLTIDITNFNFSYEYKIGKQPELFKRTIVPQKVDIENRTVNFLKTLGRYPDELARGKTNIIFLNYNPLGNTLFVPVKPEEANVVEVDFYREDANQYPVVAPKYFNSQNFIIGIFYDDSFKVLKAQIHFFEKSTDQVGIYPIKSGEAAWEELVNSKGILVSVAENQKDIIIKKMFLAYLDQDVYQDYLQPVYVFLGEKDFVAYVPAITNEYLSE